MDSICVLVDEQKRNIIKHKTWEEKSLRSIISSWFFFFFYIYDCDYLCTSEERNISTHMSKLQCSAHMYSTSKTQHIQGRVEARCTTVHAGKEWGAGDKDWNSTLVRNLIRRSSEDGKRQRSSEGGEWQKSSEGGEWQRSSEGGKWQRSSEGGKWQRLEHNTRQEPHTEIKTWKVSSVLHDAPDTNMHESVNLGERCGSSSDSVPRC